MKLINSKVELIKQESGLDGIYKQIELAGRTCYKSEDKITSDSAKDFVDRMIKSGHGAMLEHGTVYLQLLGVYLDPNDTDIIYGNYIVNNYVNNKYSKTKIIHDGELKSNIYITTNLRVLIENNWLDDLKYLCKPAEHHEKRITAKFTCDRGISHEFVRHRVFSFAQESTRYCNYSKDKFSNELIFINPSWEYTKLGNYNGNDKFDGDYFEHSLREAENYYFRLLELGWKPQQARQVLPNALKAELVMTGFESDWEHFFELRCSKAAHPDAKKLADELHKLIVK